MELPLYKNNRDGTEVRAMKIKAINYWLGFARLFPEFDGFDSFDISAMYLAGQSPRPGGYYAVDAHGNETFETAAAFTAAYTQAGGAS